MTCNSVFIISLNQQLYITLPQLSSYFFTIFVLNATISSKIFSFSRWEYKTLKQLASHKKSLEQVRLNQLIKTPTTNNLGFLDQYCIITSFNECIFTNIILNIHSPSREHKISLKTLSSRKKYPEQVCSFNLGVQSNIITTDLQFFMLNVT